MLFILLWRGET